MATTGMHPVHTGTAAERAVEAHRDECLCDFTFRCLHQLYPLRYGNMAWRSMSRPIRVRQRLIVPVRPARSPAHASHCSEPAVDASRYNARRVD
ncbi:hypothetical protein [Methanoculleus sp. MH98A]|uniref:hypothetical protein n=1 Tax=Methanoculleus sp. MH98A TaxID=1495314 RepID=UPI0012DD713C|nr:hypothetical protein [Methanoculleus sp. MH98A]